MSRVRNGQSKNRPWSLHDVVHGSVDVVIAGVAVGSVYLAGKEVLKYGRRLQHAVADSSSPSGSRKKRKPNEPLDLDVLVHEKVMIQAKMLGIRLRGMLHFQWNPITYMVFNYELFNLLQLEAIHQYDRIRLGGDVSVLNGQLPHVDTGLGMGGGGLWSWVLAKLGLGSTKSMGMGAGDTPALRDLVLVGPGHSHAFVLKSFGMRPLPGVRLTIISDTIDTPYSGMLPGYVAGIYDFDECHLDVVRMGRHAGARLIQGRVTGMDRQKKLLFIKGRPPIRYDVCSLNLGCQPSMSGKTRDSITPVKPISSFGERWETVRDAVVALGKPLRIVVVGGGPGGVELALSINSRLSKLIKDKGEDPRRVSYSIVTRGPTIMGSHNKGVQDIFKRIITEERSMELRTGFEVTDSTSDELISKTGERIKYDEVFWCTQAAAQDWLKETGLDLDEDGFIKVDAGLMSTNTPGVFACGDVASLPDPRPKAGVFAVRAGPPLAVNLRRYLLEQPLDPWEPQTRFLGLIGTGDPGNCVASKGPLFLEGKWLWDLKDWIDRKWMSNYTTALRPMAMEEDLPMLAKRSGKDALDVVRQAAMRCGGCGGKVGATILERAMKRITVPTRSEVLVGLDSPDDCCVIKADKRDSVHTVDFLKTFIDDPYVFGRIAALHSMSDLHAMGGECVSALAMVMVPYAAEDIVEDTLVQLMEGACEALREDGCALTGGHTCEGKELALGFSVSGHAENPLCKGGLKRDQKLILTKAIGTGVIFAAEMRLAARGRNVDAAIKSMCQSNRRAAEILRDHGATSCTDVTGFGLLGHLVEMAKASKHSVVLNLDQIPVLNGALECMKRGVFSSLQPQNVRLRRAVANVQSAARHPNYPVIYDPQTSGGLLASVPADRAEACVAALAKAGYTRAKDVGQVLQPCSDVTKMVNLDWDDYELGVSAT